MNCNVYELEDYGIVPNLPLSPRTGLLKLLGFGVGLAGSFNAAVGETASDLGLSLQTVERRRWLRHENFLIDILF